MDPSSQLLAYIQQGRSSGLTEDTIKSQLLLAGWSQAIIDEALNKSTNFASQQSNPSTLAQPSNPHRVRNGVLWILSPFILLVGAVLIVFLFELAGIRSPIINIVGGLMGIAGIILIFAGPIVGIIKLTRH